MNATEICVNETSIEGHFNLCWVNSRDCFLNGSAYGTFFTIKALATPLPPTLRVLKRNIWLANNNTTTIITITKKTCYSVLRLIESLWVVIKLITITEWFNYPMFFVYISLNTKGPAIFDYIKRMIQLSVIELSGGHCIFRFDTNGKK